MLLPSLENPVSATARPRRGRPLLQPDQQIENRAWFHDFSRLRKSLC
jgi:hypothetical protein